MAARLRQPLSACFPLLSHLPLGGVAVWHHSEETHTASNVHRWPLCLTQPATLPFTLEQTLSDSLLAKKNKILFI